MKDVAAALAAGTMVAVVIAGGVVAAFEVWGPQQGSLPPQPAVAASAGVHIGPDGTADTTFGDNVRGAVLANSDRFSFCYGDMLVHRPSRITTDMPDAFCTVSREGMDGPWLISTGGWQQCQAVCYDPAAEGR